MFTNKKYIKKNILLCLLCSSLLLITCKGSKKTQTENDLIISQTPATIINLEKLDVTNFSESLAGAGTLNDEILLQVFLVEKQQKIINKWTKENLIFQEKEKINSHELNTQINLANASTNSFLLFFLTELDTERTATEIEQLLINQANFSQLPTLNETEIKRQLNDDDLLGIKVLPIHTIAANKKIKLRFAGIHLFDAYEYFLYFSTK